MKNFTIKRFRKDGQPMPDTIVKGGIWVEPHKEKQEGIPYFPGTNVPHIHIISLKKIDKYNQMVGGPSPWTDPKTIKTNIPLIETENIYQELLKAKGEGNKERIEFLSQPLVEWFDPIINGYKKMYAQGKVISNRNDKSDYVYSNLHRFEEALKEFEKIYLAERLTSIRGVAALINLLSSKFAFRVGITEGKKTGVGVCTFTPKCIRVDTKGVMHFKFVGKKGVDWHKKFKPETALETCMYNDLIELVNKGNNFVFMVDGVRVTNIDVNNLFREVLNVTEEEKHWLSFHSWRHYLASKNFKRLMDELNIDQKIEKIEDKKDINTNIKKGKLLNKEINEIFKQVAPILQDKPGTVKSTYAGGKIFKELFTKYGVEFDEKKRTWNKDSYSNEIEAEKQRREQRKLEKANKKLNIC